ncbi:MAG: FkbM family methyltransferase [Firmicutes bacterium]|nr:FkbM family methyltransferase [Bacillota bacterium]
MEKKVTQVFDIKITGYESDYVFQTIEKSRYFYEGKILNKWTGYFRDAKVLLDIGANLGNHTLYWAVNTDCENIYSFEPYGPNFELLEENVKTNGLNMVTAVNAGVGEKKSKAVVKSFDEGNFGATTLQEATEESSDETMEIIDIDSFVEEQKIERVDFAKIDTEGFEEKVIAGMKNVISKFRPVLWIEVGCESFENVFENLEAKGYKVVDIEGFNVLFFPEEKSTNLKCYSIEKAIEHMFRYLEKVNIYYSNYLKSKSIIDEKDQKIISFSENYQKVKALYDNEKEKSERSEKNYQQVKIWFENEKEKRIVSEENYLKVKQWFEAEKERRIASEENYLKVKERCAVSEENYLKMKQMYANEKDRRIEADNKYSELKREHSDFIKRCDELNGKYSQQLKDEYDSNQEEMEILNELKNVIKRLETQNNYLRSENTEYQRKMQIIKDTFVGKVLVKGYHLLKKIKAKLNR